MSKQHRPRYTGYKLYLLCEPKQIDPDEEARYVGISKDTARRYREHLSGKRSTKAVRAWIRFLERRGLRPLMKGYHFEGTLEAMRRQEASVIRKLALELQEAVPFAYLPEHTTFTLLGPDAPTSETLRKVQPDTKGNNATTLDGFARWHIPDAWLCLPEFFENPENTPLTASKRQMPGVMA